MERENVFEFTERPVCRRVSEDKYEITFAVKGFCDVAVGVLDENGVVVRHLGAGVLGNNAPTPFQKDALKQTLFWNGKDDLGDYPKEPGKLRVRVMLGLKPVFDKRLGGSSAYNLPGFVWGLVAGPDGVYVFAKGQLGGATTLRKFDHDGVYAGTLLPPPPNLPGAHAAGMGYIEYEKGVRVRHAPDIGLFERSLPFDGHRPFVPQNQPALSGDRIYVCYGGTSQTGGAGGAPGRLHYLFTDSGFDLAGARGLLLRDDCPAQDPRLAVSPDGTRVYLTGFGVEGGKGIPTCVLTRETEGEKRAAVFAGEPRVPGSDTRHLNGAYGIDCDAQGRVYVADRLNNRIQVYSPEGQHLKSVSIESPYLVCVHRKTGALYVQHEPRAGGASISRVTKLASLDEPHPAAHQDGLYGIMALDSWAEKPRVWVSGTFTSSYLDMKASQRGAGHSNVTVWEERGKGFAQVLDFDEEARKEAGPGYFGRWAGSLVLGVSQAACDPLREQLYYFQAANYWNLEAADNSIFDLKSGKFLGRFRSNGARTEDIAFDKRGYLHGHTGARGCVPSVWRVDPKRSQRAPKGAGQAADETWYPEVPYDYGVEVPEAWEEWQGALAVKDQSGAKGFQDGLGVNMMDDLAVQSNIYHVPRMGEAGYEVAFAGVEARRKAGTYTDRGNYATFAREYEDRKKKGEEVYFIKREPGIPLAGSTLWTFDRNGELRRECAAIMRWLINGVQIDEEGKRYFVNASPRIFEPADGYFLCGRGGTLGDPAAKVNRFPFTGTLLKTGAEKVRLRMASAPVPLDSQPARTPDVMCTHFPDSFGKNGWGWIEGAEWLYAGASPLIASGCSCDVSRIHLDWYKRVWVPEAYRHSFGILDGNGNLILHLGRYGNFDSGSGPDSRLPIGGDQIAVTTPRFISGTDNHLVFADKGERLAVLRIEYHAQETVEIRMR